MKLAQPGDRFGRLEILLDTGERRKGHRVLLCRCQCGNTTKVKSRHLSAGQVQSCGCLAKELTEHNLAGRGRAMRLPPGENSLRHLEIEYKNKARRRGLPYALTREEFRRLTSGNCHWCGEPPRRWNRFFGKDGQRYNYRHHSEEFVAMQWVHVNGIDRLDNGCGYSVANCVSCCTPCNWFRSDRSVQDFLERVERIYKHRGLNAVVD